MTDILAQHWVGRTLAGYRILLECERGHSSVVFVGQDLLTHAPVAIKVIPPGPYADAVAAVAPTLSALDHPHIARLLTSGQVEQHFYLVYEFVPFRPPSHASPTFDATNLFSKHLAEYVQEQPTLLPLSLVIDMLQQLLDALIYAHGFRAPGTDIPYGSVRPEQVLVQLTPAGRPHLRFISFGLPQPPHRRAPADAYLSSEQLQGRPATQVSDIYALGALAYLLAIGIAPPAPLVPPSHIRSDASPAWDAFIQRALAFAPENRFHDFEDMRRALLDLRESLRSPSLLARMKTALFVNVVTGLIVVAALIAAVAYYYKTRGTSTVPPQTDIEVVSDNTSSPPLPPPPTQGEEDRVIIVDDSPTSARPTAAAAQPALDLSGSVALAGATLTTAPSPSATAPPTNLPSPKPAPQPASQPQLPTAASLAPQPPSPPPSPTPTPHPVVRSYTVKQGDTLFSIARAHQIPLHHLLAYNHLTTASVIKVGQTLLIVPPAAAPIPPQQPVSYTHL
ncbi:MAG: LysM peptidoglycan-binding domain-containing protein, partial [bacterium]|nr:LysM peptidoglycan-binding domain-containing protein [bacterium]